MTDYIPSSAIEANGYHLAMKIKESNRLPNSPSNHFFPVQ
jgi:hypothetical protein